MKTVAAAAAGTVLATSAFAQSAREVRGSFDNPDHVAILLHDCRWRLGLAEPVQIKWA